MSEFVPFKQYGKIYVPRAARASYAEKTFVKPTKNPVYVFKKGVTSKLRFVPVVRNGVELGKLCLFE